MIHFTKELKVSALNRIFILNDYTSEKKSFIENNQSISEIKGANNAQKTMLNNNLLVNEKNVKGEIIRHPKGFWNFNQE